jgi:serine/threonine-protein kinase RsbW
LDSKPPEALVIRNDLSELRRVGVWVNAWSQSRNLPTRTAQRVDLCSAEAVTNIVTHAYTDKASHQIRLKLECRDQLVALEIEDDGREFDPVQLEKPPHAVRLEDARVGGLGVHLVRSLSDELHHRRDAGRNHLTLIFRLPTT